MTWPGQSPRERRAALIVLAGLAAFVALVYAVIVLGGDALLGHTDSPRVGLSILATVLVAFAFGRVQQGLNQLATRLVNDGQPAPYDVLDTFVRTFSGIYALDEVADRMALVLGRAVQAEWCQVWLMVHGHLVLAATWPLEAVGDPAPPVGAEPPGRHVLPVREAGEALGVLRFQEGVGRPLTTVGKRLFAGLAGQAGLVLRGVRLNAERAQRYEQLAAKAQELQESRERLVRTQDAQRRQLERDIHDGAQQQLVAMAVGLRLAQTVALKSPERAANLLATQLESIQQMRATLRDLSRGVHPQVLTEQGVDAALSVALASSPLSVDVAAVDVSRYHGRIEAAVYFSCLEAVQNAVKHSGGQQISIELRGTENSLSFVVDDDGLGFEPGATSTGTGTANMRDRIEAVGGTLTLERSPRGGARVRGQVPALQLSSAEGG